MLSMRKNKRDLMSLMAVTIATRAFWSHNITDGKIIDFQFLPEVKPMAGWNKFVDGLIEDKIKENAAVEAAKVEFICLRLKDGVVVDTFDTAEAAQSLVEKHVKGRKAKLYVKNSLTNETVAFFEAA